MKKKRLTDCIPGNDPLVIARQMAEQGITLVRGLQDDKFATVF
jgi:hypothetical protein